MQSVTPPPHDPSPSLWSYRMQRWMLTPGIRFALRMGLPVLIVTIATSAFLASDVRRDALAMFVNDIRTSIQDRPEFLVNLMAIDGAGSSLSEDIRDVVPIDFPISSFDLDLEQIRAQISGLDPVKQASVRIRPGGILQITVTERVPVLVWRDHGGLSLLDETGAHVDEVMHRADWPDLPLIAGEGADTVVDEAFALVSAARPLGGRLRGLVRMGERRWDVVLDRDQRILLPSQDPVPALERVLALAEASDLLERDVAVVDMRLAERPTLRLTEQAVGEMRRLKQTKADGH